MKLLWVLTAAAVVSGCIYRPDIDTRVAVTERPILPPRAQTLDWGHLGRGGAVGRQPGWVHVLAEKPLNHDLEQRDYPPSPVRSEPVSVPDRASQRAYSHYELERWHRYCNSGKGMDRRDREFVRKENYRVPESLAPDCQPPRR